MLRRLFRKLVMFDKVPAKEDNQALLEMSAASSTLSIEVEDAVTKHEDSSARVAVRIAFICSAIYIGIGVCIAIILKDARFIDDADSFCLSRISRYSPVRNEVLPNWHIVQFNGTFLHENIYRQRAGPEVDAAWDALGTDYRSVAIPEAEAEESGLRPDQVKITEFYGGGFPANVEGLHHLHCLNLMRKTLWWNYEYYRDKKEGPFQNSEYIVQLHTTHCMDILRQQLMCTPDVGVLGQVWWQSEDGPEPFVDFNTQHVCRDFEAIREWAAKHQLPPEEELDMSRYYEPPRPGDTIYPTIPKALRGK